MNSALNATIAFVTSIRGSSRRTFHRRAVPISAVPNSKQGKIQTISACALPESVRIFSRFVLPVSMLVRPQCPSPARMKRKPIRLVTTHRFRDDETDYSGARLHRFTNERCRFGSGVPHSVQTKDLPLGYAHLGHRPTMIRNLRRI